MTSALFSPYKINGLELANRINVAPMCQYSAADGVIGDWHMTHLGMLANSGAGLVFVEMSDVERRGRITHGCVGISSTTASVSAPPSSAFRSRMPGARPPRKSRGKAGRD